METLNKPKLLVIGGTGFIGHHLMSAAKSQWDVTSVSLRPPMPARFVDSVKYLHLDISNPYSASRLFGESYEYVVNLGGYVDHKAFSDGGVVTLDNHFGAVRNLVSALPRDSLKRFVQIGSSDEYGDSPAPQHEEMRERPISPYSCAKAANAHFLQMLNLSEDFPSVILRLFLVYGPGQHQERFLPQVIEACLQNQEFPTSEGNQIRDFCYIQDIVRAILCALKEEHAVGQVINIGSGIPITIREVVSTVQQIIGRGHPSIGKIPYRPGESKSLYADIRKAKHLLGWSPQISLLEGLKKTIDAHSQTMEYSK